MDAERRAEITGWDAREFSDGFAGLGRLVDRGFSGAVTNGTGWLFVFEGRVVGTADADLDAFADASGTVYEAPAAVLPVLFAMQERGGEPRAQYYTNDTPLSEADRKLTQGGFTGYVELSENVLSGDYYVTYTAGESMAAAYVGNSRRLETGDEAFELADDEVGIYTVYEVDLDVQEIPAAEASGGATTAGGDTAGEDTAVESEADEPVEDETDEEGPVRDATPGDEAADAGAETATAAVDSESSDGETVDREETPRPGARDDGGEDGETPPSPGERAGEPIESEPAADTVERENAERADESAEADAATERAATSETSDPSDAPDAADEPEPGSEGDHPSDDVFSEEEQWREQKSIPALDPSEASDPPGDRSRGEAESDAAGRPPREASERRRSGSAGRSGAAGSAAANGDERSPEPRSTERDRSDRSAVSQRASGASAGERGERFLNTSEPDKRAQDCECYPEEQRCCPPVAVHATGCTPDGGFNPPNRGPDRRCFCLPRCN